MVDRVNEAGPRLLDWGFGGAKRRRVLSLRAAGRALAGRRAPRSSTATFANAHRPCVRAGAQQRRKRGHMRARRPPKRRAASRPQLIARMAAQGPEASVDVDQAALRVTLDIIGLAGFGHDYGSVKQDVPPYDHLLVRSTHVVPPCAPPLHCSFGHQGLRRLGWPRRSTAGTDAVVTTGDVPRGQRLLRPRGGPAPPAGTIPQVSTPAPPPQNHPIPPTPQKPSACCLAASPRSCCA